MDMDWKTFVEKDQAKTNVLPPGWDSREKIAEQMGCSVDSARKLLAPAVKAGTVEMDVFPVWDNMIKKITRVTAYRKTPAQAKPAPTKPAKSSSTAAKSSA